MWPESEKLKLGKGDGVRQERLRRLPLSDGEFEADFWLDPAFSTQRREVWTGMVIEREFGALLAMGDVERPPTVNDLATLLAHSMFRPLDVGDRQRPRMTCLGIVPSGRNCCHTSGNLGSKSSLGMHDSMH